MEYGAFAGRTAKRADKIHGVAEETMD
jgi:hypothetical protein